MWQRIQTVFLILAIIPNALIFWLELAEVNTGETLLGFKMYGITSPTGEVLYSTIWLAVVTTVSILLSAWIIFSYRKRQVQIKLAKLNLFVQAVLMVAIFFTIDSALSNMQLSNDQISYEIGTYISVLPLLFIYLAIRSIKKDEALVRAADRIR